MPRAKEIREIKFPNGETFPVVFFEGIAHIIIDRISTYNSGLNIDNDLKCKLESNIKEWCDFLQVPAVGVIFYDKANIIPLVYVKSIDTLYWENSCASGSDAIGEYFTKKSNKNVSISLRQPSGVDLIVESVGEKLYLKGKVRLLYKNVLTV